MVDATEDSSLSSQIRYWTWLDGRRFETSAWRCLGCAAIATGKRRFEKRYEKHEPTPGVYAPWDGVRWRVERT